MNQTQSPAGLLCPGCRVGLVTSRRRGVEIDACPKCHGVWLDRGEFDAVIERAVREARTAAAPISFPPPAVVRAVWPQPCANDSTRFGPPRRYRGDDGDSRRDAPRQRDNPFDRLFD